MSTVTDFSESRNNQSESTPQKTFRDSHGLADLPSPMSQVIEFLLAYKPKADKVAPEAKRALQAQVDPEAQP